MKAPDSTAGPPLAFGAEEQQAEALQREVHANRCDQQHQHGGVRQRLEGDAIEIDADHCHDHQRQRDADRHRRLLRGEVDGQRQHDGRQHDVGDEAADDQPPMQRLARHEQVEGEGADAQRERKLRRARHLARGQRGVGQRAIGDEFALGNEDDAGDGEHQHQRQTEQRVDCAIGDAVLHQEQHDGGVQDRTLPLKIGDRPPQLRWMVPTQPLKNADDI
ncbi:hypothetical protein ACVMBY_004747 [Bradyrhizobium huanghuaihaiense]